MFVCRESEPMPRLKTTTAFVTAGLLIAGCGSGNSLFRSPNAEATAQWNTARASALGSLAADQLRDGNFDKCQQSLDQALKLQPKDVNLLVMAARLSIEQGKLEYADEYLVEARKLDPARAEIDYLSGIVYQRWQQTVKARAAYAAAGGKNPAEPSYLLAEAEMLVASGEPAQALTLLQSKLSRFENSGVVRHEIGLLLAAVGKPKEAVTALREAGRLMADDLSIREHLAFTLIAAKEYPEAVEVLDRLVKQPEYEKRADAYAALGESLAQTQRYFEGQRAYEMATKLDDVTPGYWLGLARLALLAGDLPRADLAVRKAVSLRSTSGDAQCLLGYVRLKQNQLTSSLNAFQAAASLDQTDSVSVCMQGYVLTKMGRAADAQACFARAKTITNQTQPAGQLLVTINPSE
ncbi:MAG: hypothetical protein JWM57_2102 [Phycisphaerales bacterium]|nr:hypothetical protein [Phycisphaerales bacterium]